MLTQIWNATDIFFCHFMPFFAHLSHYGPQILTFGKNVKNTWRYYLFVNVHVCTINQEQMLYGF